MRKLILTAVLLGAMVSCKKEVKNETQNTPSEAEVTVTNENQGQVKSSAFEGTYTSGDKAKGEYWTEVKISAKEGDSCQVTATSSEIKGRACCSFDKTGYLKNDTIFIDIKEWKKPVTVFLTKKDDKISFDAIEKEDGDRFVLNWYCCGGGSLIGDYQKK